MQSLNQNMRDSLAGLADMAARMDSARQNLMSLAWRERTQRSDSHKKFLLGYKVLTQM
jgi:hypothetical protein